MLEVRGLTVRFGEMAALDDVDLEVADGEVLAVLGPSGSGKTTLLRVIAGLHAADAGAVAWDGHELGRVPSHERGFGLMFQDYALFPHKTVAGNVAFGLRMAGDDPEQVALRTAEVLEWVSLTGYERRLIGSLSGGEQQRVALARALAPAPRLLMLDEPVGSLDRALRERLIAEMRSLFAEHGITAVYVTHDQEEAFAICDRLVILRRGRVAQRGTAEEVWRRPADEWVARFLGFENIVDADLAAGEAITSWATFPVADPGAGRHRVVLRPDAFTPAKHGQVRGTVTARTFRGGHYLLRLQVTGGPELDVELDRGPAPQPGEDLQLAVDPSGVVVLEEPPAGAASPAV